MSGWSGLDFFIFLILILNIVLGMARGASREIISMLCLCAALVITIKFTIPLSAFLDSSPLIQDVITAGPVINFMSAIGAGPLTAQTLYQLSYSISILILFVGVFSICDGVLGYTGIVESYSFPYATMNRKVGGSLGFIRGFVITLIFIIILQHLYTGNPGNISGYFVSLFKGPAQTLDSIIIAQQPERYREILEQKGVNEQQLLEQLRNPT